jgi:hypothetical protein
MMAKHRTSIIVLQVRNLSTAYNPDDVKWPCQAFNRVANKHRKQPVVEEELRRYQVSIVSRPMIYQVAFDSKV